MNKGQKNFKINKKNIPGAINYYRKDQMFTPMLANYFSKLKAVKFGI